MLDLLAQDAGPGRAALGAAAAARPRGRVEGRADETIYTYTCLCLRICILVTYTCR